VPSADWTSLVEIHCDLKLGFDRLKKMDKAMLSKQISGDWKFTYARDILDEVEEVHANLCRLQNEYAIQKRI